MQQVPVFEAKNKLPMLLHLIEAGKMIEITRHGKPVAVLVQKDAISDSLIKNSEDPFEKAYHIFRSKLEENQDWDDSQWKAVFEIPRSSCQLRHTEDFI